MKSIKTGVVITILLGISTFFASDATRKQRRAETTCVEASEPEELLQRAQTGDVRAMVDLAWLYDHSCVDKNEQETIKWLIQAVRAGNSEAQNHLGFKYAMGKGVARDDQEALRLYRQAAQDNNTKAINNLGVWYAVGRSVARNLQQARELFQQAIGAASDYHVDNAIAMCNLGVLYAQGMGVNQSMEEAFKLFYKAAALDNPHAKFIIGKIYEEGRGVEKDEVYAQWWRAASFHGAPCCLLGRDEPVRMQTEQQVLKLGKLSECTDFSDEMRRCSIQDTYGLQTSVVPVVFEEEDVEESQSARAPGAAGPSCVLQKNELHTDSEQVELQQVQLVSAQEEIQRLQTEMQRMQAAQAAQNTAHAQELQKQQAALHDAEQEMRSRAHAEELEGIRRQQVRSEEEQRLHQEAIAAQAREQQQRLQAEIASLQAGAATHTRELQEQRRGAQEQQQRDATEIQRLQAQVSELTERLARVLHPPTYDEVMGQGAARSS